MISADAKDLSFVTVRLVDKKGVIIPDAHQLIQFSISGPGLIAAVDNGDPVSHEPFKGSQHKLMAGLALVIIQSSGTAGPITLTAKAAGLPETSIVIETLPVSK